MIADILKLYPESTAHSPPMGFRVRKPVPSKHLHISINQYSDDCTYPSFHGTLHGRYLHDTFLNFPRMYNAFLLVYISELV